MHELRAPVHCAKRMCVDFRIIATVQTMLNQHLTRLTITRIANRLRYFPFVFLVAGTFCNPAFAATPAIEIEVINEGVRSPTAPQEWAEILGRAGFARVSIRSRKSGDATGIENIGTSQVPRYRVTAFLRNDKLVLPPGDRFGKRDLRQLRSWIEKFQNDITAQASPKGPFGLSSQQLNLLREQMAVPVRQKTAGQLPKRILTAILRNRPPAVELATGSRRELEARDVVLTNELEGVATGTALAALLRPVGLGLHPEVSGSRVRWTVVERGAAESVWPVGWESDQSAGRTLPILGKRVETQKVTLPLDAAIRQLAERMNVSLLVDERELEAEEIDLTAEVSMREGRFLYSAVLRHLLRQQGLSFAVRLDDSAKPFLWVSTYRSLRSP